MNSSGQDQVFERAAKWFALLSTRMRLRLRLQIVRALLDGERNVGQLIDSLGASQPKLSHHLAVLYRSGLLRRRRDGSHVVYRIADDRLDMLARWLATQGQTLDHFWRSVREGR